MFYFHAETPSAFRDCTNIRVVEDNVSLFKKLYKTDTLFVIHNLNLDGIIFMPPNDMKLAIAQIMANIIK